MAALNANSGVRLGSPHVAALILFCVAFVSTAGIVFARGFPSQLDLSTLSPQHWGAGMFIVFYVLSITTIAPKIGLGNAVFLVLLGQIISATCIDHWGLFGAMRIGLSAKRVCGVLLLALGVYFSGPGK